MGLKSLVAAVLRSTRSQACSLRPSGDPDRPKLRARQRLAFETLESRCLLSATIIQPITPVTIGGSGTATLDLGQNFSDPSLTGTFVNFTTSLGRVEVQLFDQQTPRTVANFLQYVNQGLYNNTIIHRSPPGFVVQGGGFNASGVHIPTFAPVQNEPQFSNVAGTIALAKVGGDPNSGTSEFFFNVANNSQNLDNQNGGFTVFGRVVSGLNVVDSINQLPTTTATLGTTSFTDLPVVNLASGAQPTAANLINVTSVAVTSTPTLTISAFGSNTSIVTPHVSGQTLTLDATGPSGYSSVTVTASGPDGRAVEQTFRVHVVGAATATRQVVLGATGTRTVAFRDSNNQPGSLTYTGPGTATINFLANSFATPGGSVRGTNVQLDSIAVTGSTSASTLDINGPASTRRSLALGGITVNGSLRMLRLHHATLSSDLAVTGSVKTLQIDSASFGNITIGAGTKLDVTGTSFTNEGLTSASPIGQLRVRGWVNADATQPVTAPSVDQVTTRGNFTPGLILTVAPGRVALLKRISVPGLIGGTWNIPGKLPRLTIGGTSDDFAGTFTSAIPILHLANFSGSLTVPSIRSLRVTGNIANATLTLNAPLAPRQTDLGNLTVLGQINQSSIISTGSIGSISTRGIILSDIYAGVASVAPGTSLPGTVTDFAGQATIGPVSARPFRSSLSFSGSNIAAYSLGSLSLGTGSTSNSGTPFGVAAHSIQSLDLRDRTLSQSFHFGRLTSAAQVASLVAARKLTLADLRITLI